MNTWLAAWHLWISLVMTTYRLEDHTEFHHSLFSPIFLLYVVARGRTMIPAWNDDPPRTASHQRWKHWPTMMDPSLACNPTPWEFTSIWVMWVYTTYSQSRCMIVDCMSTRAACANLRLRMSFAFVTMNLLMEGSHVLLGDKSAGGGSTMSSGKYSCCHSEERTS